MAAGEEDAEHTPVTPDESGGDSGVVPQSPGGALRATDENETAERLPEDAREREVQLLPFSELEIGPEIGRGAFSRVYSGKWRGKVVAIKKMRVPSGVSLEDKADLRNLRTEIALMASLKDDNVMGYYGVALKGRNVYLCTEFLDGGPLSRLVFSDAELSWRLRVYLALGMARGLSYLHEREVVHRDVKTDNILLDLGRSRAVLADYGFARRAAEEGTAMTLCGTDEFMAPEVIWGEGYDARADVFSMGMVMVELATRRHVGKDDYLVRHARTKFQLDMDQLEESFPEDTPPSFLECVKQCLADEPDERLESQAVVDWLDELYNELSEGDEEPPKVPDMK